MHSNENIIFHSGGSGNSSRAHNYCRATAADHKIDGEQVYSPCSTHSPRPPASCMDVKRHEPSLAPSPLTGRLLSSFYRREQTGGQKCDDLMTNGHYSEVPETGQWPTTCLCLATTETPEMRLLDWEITATAAVTGGYASRWRRSANLHRHMALSNSLHCDVPSHHRHLDGFYQYRSGVPSHHRHPDGFNRSPLRAHIAHASTRPPAHH